MASEVERVDFGMTDKGQVVMLTLDHQDDFGNVSFTYQVRHGVRTVGEYTAKAKAEAVGKALVA